MPNDRPFLEEVCYTWPIWRSSKSNKGTPTPIALRRFRALTGPIFPKCPSFTHLKHNFFDDFELRLASLFSSPPHFAVVTFRFFSRCLCLKLTIFPQLRKKYGTDRLFSVQISKPACCNSWSFILSNKCWHNLLPFFKKSFQWWQVRMLLFIFFYYYQMWICIHVLQFRDSPCITKTVLRTKGPSSALWDSCKEKTNKEEIYRLESEWKVIIV